MALVRRKSEFRILHGPLKDIETDMNTAAASGWSAMGPPVFTKTYQVSADAIRTYFVVTMIRKIEAARLDEHDC